MDLHYRPKDGHAAALISEAESCEIMDYDKEALFGLIEDLCSAVKRAHLAIETHKCQTTHSA